MDHRYSRKLLGVAVAFTLSVSLFAPTPALPSDEPTRGNRLAATPPPLSHPDNYLTAAVVSSPSTQSVQPRSAALAGTLQKSNEDEGATRNGLAHSSRGMQALTAGDRAKAQEELEISIGILSKISGVAASDGLRLQLIEETALLKAALSGASSGQEADSLANEQEEENEADTETAPDLIVPEEAPRPSSPGGEIVSMPELDVSNFDVPIVLNEQVKAYIEYYQTRKWGVMNRAFERAGRYLPMMRRIFRDQGLPLELINLPYIESAFNYRAYSKAKASGIWQFIEPTGNRFGMRVNYWLDERRDPEKATRGAATYLKELYGMFHSWPLALAAYNAGEQRIQRAIEQQGTTDFWSLRLPKETQLFVPAFMAVTIIAKDPNRYGFAAPVEEPWEVERVTVPGAIELRSVARVVGVPSDVVRDLNPALMRGVTPVNASKHKILLPPGTKEILSAKLDQLPRYSYREPVRPTVKRHQVRRGETLRSIASQHQTAATVLADLNGLRAGDSLKVGAWLRLPPVAPSRKLASTSGRVTQPQTAAAQVSKVASLVRSAVHVVRRGETLWGIAKAYAVTPEELQKWNDLERQVELKPGQSLQVIAQTEKNNRKVGGAGAFTAPARYYHVKSGDTLWGIARIHDVTPDQLRRWNDLGHQAKLLVGQKLIIRLSES